MMLGRGSRGVTRLRPLACILIMAGSGARSRPVSFMAFSRPPRGALFYRVGAGDAVAAELAGPRGRRDRRPAMIHRGVQGLVAEGCLTVLALRRGRRMMLLVLRFPLGGRRLGSDAAWAAVKADVDVMVDDGLVVDVGDVNAAEIVDRTVVMERTMIPEAAVIAGTAIAEAVIDAAVEAHVGPPVAVVKDVDAIIPTPIARGPQ
jgi:hypothetical protein